MQILIFLPVLALLALAFGVMASLFVGYGDRILSALAGDEIGSMDGVNFAPKPRRKIRPMDSVNFVAKPRINARRMGHITEALAA
jgi:hypothetical protein